MAEIERFLRIQRRTKDRSSTWETLPAAGRMQIWAMSKVDDEDAEPLMIFHIGFVDGVRKGCRAVYLGQVFDISEVSDSPKLRGLELRCRPASRPQALQETA